MFSSTHIYDSILAALQASGRSFKQTRRSLVIDCPACGKEDKCYILKEKGHGICFVCSTKWSVRGLVSVLMGISGQEAEARLRGYTGDNKFDEDTQQKLVLALVPSTKGTSEITDADFEDTEIPYEEFYFDPNFVDVWKSERAISYLIQRGCTDESIWIRWDLKYHAGLDAVVAPISMFGTKIGYQARFITPRDPKFRMKTSPGLPRDRALMNYDTAYKMNSVIVVEGIFDCLKTDLQKHGYGSIATMGKVISKGQIDLMNAMPAKTIYLALDRDAHDLIPELYSALKGTKEIFRLLPPKDRKDFGECSEEEVLQALETAQPRIVSDNSDRFEVFMK